MASETVMGIVLSSSNIGEADRRIVLLTREKGKISAFARGAVRPKSPLVTATRPFTFGEFFMYAGRDSYTVTGAEVSNHFDGLTKDLEIYYYASYLCEIADYYTRENLYAGDVLLLLYQSLKALEKQTIGSELVRYIFEWRMMLINGEAPEVFCCVKCHKNASEGARPEYFSVSNHGLVCKNCSKECPDAVQLLPSAVYALQFVISTPLQKLYTFKVTDEVLTQIKSVTDSYLQVNRDHKFNSLGFIETDMGL